MRCLVKKHILKHRNKTFKSKLQKKTRIGASHFVRYLTATNKNTIIQISFSGQILYATKDSEIGNKQELGIETELTITKKSKQQKYSIDKGRSAVS